MTKDFGQAFGMTSNHGTVCIKRRRGFRKHHDSNDGSGKRGDETVKVVFLCRIEANRIYCIVDSYRHHLGTEQLNAMKVSQSEMPTDPSVPKLQQHLSLCLYFYTATDNAAFSSKFHLDSFLIHHYHHNYRRTYHRRQPSMGHLYSLSLP